MAAAPTKASQQLARQLFALSLVNGLVAPAQVEGVLAYLEKHPPAQPLQVLQAYRRLVARELAKGEIVVEHAGPIGEGILRGLEGAFTQKYKRQVTARGVHNASLIAGLRLRIGDDVYEASIANQLAQLSAA
ncbi:ATP synthase F0F1 subunit delta [Cephaloticoccus primus]|uniref:ATP synthase F0F1 subunit delta n=1 Tax=Cephaloticoccus primus TaxID=1548207 RepID=A0A139SHV2_9BACT|nr:F0F1 ATP synthase subunit delta [Cephaloticoccus primus]KXU34129.1 ATP synthase F0F1 subunit delta [Cephaloticoccus primus]